MFTLTQNRWKIDDVLGVRPLTACAARRNGIAAGIFGPGPLGSMGGVAFMSHAGRHVGIVVALTGGFIVRRHQAAVGLRHWTRRNSTADLSIHKISASPERGDPW